MTSDKQTHIIRNMHLRLKLPAVDKAFRLQQQLKACLDSEWMDALSRTLDQYAGAAEYLHVPRLEIDLAQLPEEDIEKHFRKAALEAVEKALVELLQQQAMQNAAPATPAASAVLARVSLEQQDMDGWFYFLEKGTLPWWMVADQKTDQRWIGAIRAKPALFRERWKQAWRHNEINVVRWVEQSSPALRQVMLELLCDTVLYEQFRLLLTTIEQWLPRLPLAKVRYTSWHCFFDFIDSEALSRQSLRQTVIGRFTTRWATYCGQPLTAQQVDILLGQGAPSPAIESKATSWQKATAATPSQQAKPAMTTLPEEGLAINNAGLVLLHPFLVHLFRKLEWLTEKDHQLREDAVDRAVHLLAFLASGETQLPEYEMVLCKILCGVAPERAIVREVTLTEEEKQQAETLLQAVLEHWTPLNNTSIAALRETFLQRPGLLFNKDGEWVIQVEQRTVDVLLNRLPWGVSIIRLPWVPQLFRVNWAL
ncbi:contractile injection system tape measure protein [Chitinophaga horti]|uniref:Contractile injection system tape measure protein n=1 Tax=Chitinophaga horti TaxID=2920382 RepID=A0ABY6J1M9_9BACT|nr:contractile injection system tape measure protein [Chitinophaga horti]UYQ93540.1 contractile injection system tape measure protein [Chitinophaga horti]